MTWVEAMAVTLEETIGVAAKALPIELEKSVASRDPLSRERRDRYSNGLLIGVDIPHYEHFLMRLQNQYSPE